MPELTAAQQLMIADGLPAAAVMPQTERTAAWSRRPPKDIQYARDMLRVVSQGQKAATQKELAMKTAAKASKADQVAALRTRRATEKGSGAAKPKAAAKKAAKAKARTPASPKPATPGSKVIRPGSKLEIVVGLLTRKEGCTAAEILAATEWPAVSVPQQARSAGLTLRQEKDGKVTRYWAS
jgi:hypothetical protein